MRGRRKIWKSALLAASLLSASVVLAQETPNAPAPQPTSTAARARGETFGGLNYANGSGYFHNPFAPYKAKEVPPPNLSNSPRIDQLMHDGKIMLSMSDAVALALENNLDIAIARYNLPIADTDILRAKAGQGLRGVPTGLVQGTPGGGQGGIGTTAAQGAGPGGTTTGAGGAGAGNAGIVQSTSGAGPLVEQFDPSLTGSLSEEHAITPEVNTVFTGVPNLQSNTGTVNFSYNQGFATGTALSVGFQNNRQTTNSLFNTLNPTLNTNFRATVTQHLLQGFGIGLNTRFIRIARNSREIADVAFRDQVIQTVSQIEDIYWDLVNAYEQVKAKERAVTLAQKTLSDNQKQVQIGTLAPIEVVRAQSTVASNQEALIVAQTNLQLQQLLMKNALSRNLSDPILAAAPVIPTDTASIPAEEPVVPIQDLINDALSHRPDLAEGRIDLTNREITRKATANGLLPSLDFVAFYGASALGGVQNPLSVCQPGATGFLASICSPAGAIPNHGYTDTFGNLFNSTAPDKGMGLQLTIPIRNRSAQADQMRSELELRQAQMRLQQLQNEVAIQVRNSQFTVQQDRAQVEAAEKALELSQQSLEAEQKKYALGASTNFNVLQQESDLATSDSNLVQARAAYEKARVDLDRVSGYTLIRNGIVLDDAFTGVVTKQPVVPYVSPRQDTTPTQQQQTPQPNGR
ncbi:MAG TPA: TolC family protein [Terriglobales bacterium]|nr:TolC family protein [Terriglobales bacterium]